MNVRESQRQTWSSANQLCFKSNTSEKQSWKKSLPSVERSDVLSSSIKIWVDHTERKQVLLSACPTFRTAHLFTITCPPLLLSLWDQQCLPVDGPISLILCLCYILWHSKITGSGCLQSHNMTVFFPLLSWGLPGNSLPRNPPGRYSQDPIKCLLECN